MLGSIWGRGDFGGVVGVPPAAGGHARLLVVVVPRSQVTPPPCPAPATSCRLDARRG